MGIEGLVQSVSAGVGAALAVGVAARKYWTGREVRQQAAFRAAVQYIVDQKAAELLAVIHQVEHRQGQHLDRQDRAIANLQKAIGSQKGRARD